MSRPPIEAMKSIKKYCENRNCEICVFGKSTDYNDPYVSCMLVGKLPCDWKIEEEDNKND